MSKPEQLSNVWEKDFGRKYTNRKLLAHKVEGKKREEFWRSFVEKLPDVKSYLEIGCNAGMNLEAICKAKPKLSITGLEPNPYAFKIAVEKAKGRYKIVNGSVYDMPFTLKADLVFTCTVLIHIAPENIKSAFKKIYKASNKYILALEYYWPTVKPLEYRGLKNALWKQDFGALWLKNFDLEVIDTGYLDARDGFDRLTWWLFKK